MATTNLYAVRAGKDGDALKAVQRVIGYVENPEKTERKRLITSYACDPRTAAEEFMLDKRAYIHRTGRERGKDDVLAYHLRQSFAPGEITPEEANRLGYELAMRFTKGRHSFIVATHTDKAHIHNHIIANAINLDCDRKFRDFQGSKKALARLSDMICLENGYSVIEHPKNKGKKYNKWLGENYRRTHRDELRENIDIALMEKPRTLEELLKLLEAAGWEIKHGRHISFRKPGQEISTLKIHITNYIRTREVYQDYHKHGNSKRFAAAHERELAIHQEAKRAFDALGLKKLPSIKSLSAEYDQIIAEKKRIYAEYRKVHEEMQELLTVRANMEQMLQQDAALKTQERSHTHAR